MREEREGKKGNRDQGLGIREEDVLEEDAENVEKKMRETHRFLPTRHPPRPWRASRLGENSS